MSLLLRRRSIIAAQAAVSLSYLDHLLSLGPLLVWPLDDESGTTVAAAAGPNGAYFGGPTLRATGPTSKIPYAIQTDGSDDRAEVSSSIFPQAADVSMSIWVKWTSTTLTRVPMMLRTSNSNSEEIGLLCNRNSAGRVSLYRATNDRAAHSGGYNDGNWHNIVGVVDAAGNSSELYIDGVSVASGVAGVPADSSERTLWVGSNRPSDSQAFPGSIAMLAVFDFPLTATEVADLYAAAL